MSLCSRERHPDLVVAHRVQQLQGLALLVESLACKPLATEKFTVFVFIALFIFNFEINMFLTVHKMNNERLVVRFCVCFP